MRLNPSHLTDGYKTGHIRQFPEKTTVVYSNFTPRSDKHLATWTGYDHKVVWFGLQGIIRWYLVDLWNTQFFDRPKSVVVADYKRRMDLYLGADAVSVDHIAALHDLQRLPIEIKSLPEGSRVDIRVPLFTIKNTEPEFYWLTNYLETSLSALLWKSITSATTAYEYRRMFEDYAKLTGGDLAFVDWQGHDFSFRGMSGIEDAILSGAAHLTSFTGTDTIPAIDYIEDYYGAMQTLIGASVPATEHAVACLSSVDYAEESYVTQVEEYFDDGLKTWMPLKYLA
jgi:nicotinamide phosphoribosyltransferase